MNKIDLSKIHPNELCKCKGFVYNGSVFIYLHDAMKLIGLKLEDGSSTIYNWRSTHYFFRQAMGLLHINDNEYELPLNHVPIRRNGPITDYQANLPLYIKDVVLLKMASLRNNYEETQPRINMVISEFRLCKNLNKADNKYYKENNCTQVCNYFEDELGGNNMNNNENLKPNENNCTPVCNYLNNVKPIECYLDGRLLKGFVKNGNIYLNSINVGHMLGLDRDNINKSGELTLIITWDRFYKRYRQALYQLGEDPDTYNAGFNLMTPTNKAGASSKYQQMIPEYIPIMVVFSMALICDSNEAFTFKMNILTIVLPYFLNNVSDVERNKVYMFGHLNPLLAESAKQNDGIIMKPYQRVTPLSGLSKNPPSAPVCQPEVKPHLGLSIIKQQMEMEYFSQHQEEHMQYMQMAQPNHKSVVAYDTNKMSDEDYQKYLDNITKRMSGQ